VVEQAVNVADISPHRVYGQPTLGPQMGAEIVEGGGELRRERVGAVSWHRAGTSGGGHDSTVDAGSDDVKDPPARVGGRAPL